MVILEAASKGSDPSFASSMVAPAAVIAAAALTALAAVVVYYFTQRQAARERKRRTCAEALADALAWMELPYRVTRRASDSPDVLSELTSHIHSLQERLLFHESWLQIELPEAGAEYRALVAAVRDAARQAMRAAWDGPAAAAPASMNIGDLGLASIDLQVVAFVEKVRGTIS